MHIPDFAFVCSSALAVQALCVQALPAQILPLEYQAAVFQHADLRAPGIPFDADGDGDLDILGLGGSVDLLRNTGWGQWQREPIATSSVPVAVGDMDGDGDLDLVFALAIPPRILANDGAGRFSAANNALGNATGDPIEVVLWDFDGDGDLDVLEVHTGTFDPAVPGNFRPNPERIYRNDGPGVLTSVTVQGATIATGGVAADFDGNGADEVLVSANRVVYHYSVVAGVVTVQTIAAPTSVVDMVIFDAEGDGDPDVAIAGRQATYLLENTAGTFSWRALHQSGFTTGIAQGDIDGDGDADLLTTIGADSQPFAPNLQVLLENDGSGNFTEEAAVRMPELRDRATRPVFFDHDGDGDLDLMVEQLDRVRTLHNDGNGFFKSLETIDLDVATVVWRDADFGDVDGNSTVDAVVTVNHALSRPVPNGPAVLLVRTAANGELAIDPIPLDLPRTQFESVDLLDCDLDGDLDLLAVSWLGQFLLINDGAGNFSNQTLTRLLTASSAIALCDHADVDGDGDPDLILGGDASLPLQLVRNLGGAFAYDPTMLATLVFAERARFGDIDGDGDQDLVTTLGAGGLLQFDNDGTGAFSPASVAVIGTTNDIIDLVTGDFDNDGNAEVLAMTATGPRLFRAIGGGLVEQNGATIPGPRLVSPEAIDFDRDGDLDVVGGLASGFGCVALVNDGVGRFSFTQNLSGARAWLHDVDLDGDMDLLGPRLLRNQTRQLRVTTPPMLGRPCRIDARAVAGSAFAILAFDSARLATPQSLSFGSLWLDPTTLQVASLLAPLPAQFEFPIPANPNLVGSTMYLQALFDGGSNAPLTLSNFTSLEVRL